MLLVIDGPEKAGKTTLVAALKQWWDTAYPESGGTPRARVRKWGRLDDGKWTVDSVYRDALVEDATYEGLVVWDRSWASEAVYSGLLHRNRRLGTDPWLGEWLYGRGVDLKFILGGPHPSVTELDLDEDDHVHNIDPRVEQAAFLAYARRWGWTVVGHTDRDRLPLSTLLNLIQLRVAAQSVRQRDPRLWCGPREASVALVGERGSNKDSLVGGWLPFSSLYTTGYGRLLGSTAMRAGWTNAWDDQRQIFDSARLIIACGSSAFEWAREVQKVEQRDGTRVEQVYHPAALYRWGRLRPYIPAVEARIRELIQGLMPVDDPLPM